MSASKAKGTSWETNIVNALTLNRFRARRKVLSGSLDQGDIEIDGLRLHIVIEAKNCAKMALSQWVDEALNEAHNAKAELGVVWHHRKGRASPLNGYVTMSGASFLLLLEHLRGEIHAGR